MKKTVLLLLTLLLCVQPLLGAVASEESYSGNLRFAYWGSQRRAEITTEAIDMFLEQYPDLTIDSNIYDWESYWDLMMTYATGNELPDIIQMDIHYLNTYVANNLLMDLTPFIESGVLNVSDMSDGLLESGSIAGNPYAICVGQNSVATIYNKTITDAAGIVIPDFMTVEEYKQVGRDVFEKLGIPTNYAYAKEGDYLEVFCRSAGYDLYTPDGEKFGMPDDSIFRAYFSDIESSVVEGYHIDPVVFVETNATSPDTNPVVNGGTWNLLGHTNNLGQYAAAAIEGADLHLTAFPADNAKLGNYTKPAQFFCITSGSKNPEAAAAFINFWTNSVEANEILLAERGMPASNVVALAIAPLLNISQQRAAEMLVKIGENCSPISPLAPLGATEINTMINELTERICYGDITGDAAGTYLFTEGNTLLQAAYESLQQQ
jgi:ABC-type sugar transport system, periplasmic component